ncbi:agamous-like MADS-box protein AGL66 [Gossypium australe]|uniref:Agamous-like MADS-box protein AGL66 n=1 Tax=Gossypium australe TaxID=47621 RepID=A0A5B6UGY4_9ROSI|nr:agamous-like MADS-box protein AGL66 [Gossypium australe]
MKRRSCFTLNLELQLKKTTVELEILHTNLKEYEVEDEKKASLSQIKWCETNLQNTLEEIKDRKRSVGRQTPWAYNGTTGNRVLNRGSQNLNSSRLMQQHDLRTCPFSSMAHNVLLDHLYHSRGVSAGHRGASGSSGFNPLAAGAGLSQHAAIPPAYPQIQIHPGIRNSQNGMSGNSLMVLCQPMLHGIMDQQQGLGGLGSSSTQPVRENLITPSIPNQQLGALAGGSFLNQSLLGNGNMTSNVQFEPQQRGIIGSTSVGQPANNVLSRGQANQMPAIQKVNSQNGVSPVPLTSQAQVNPNETNLLCNPMSNTGQNLDVTAPVNSERDPSESIIITPTLGNGNNVNDGNINNNSTNKNISVTTLENGDNVNNGDIGDSSTNTISNNETNQKEKPIQRPS